MEPTSRRSLLQSLVAAPAVALLSPSREASASVLELPKPIVLPPLENALESHDCVAHFCLPFDREEYDRVWPVSDGLRAHVWVKDRADLSINARFRSVICGISSTPNIFRPIEVRVLCKDGSLWGSKEGRLQHLEPGELLIRRGILTGTSGTPFCMDSVEVLRGGLFDVGSALRDVEKSERYAQLLAISGPKKKRRAQEDALHTQMDRGEISHFEITYYYMPVPERVVNGAEGRWIGEGRYAHR